MSLRELGDPTDTSDINNTSRIPLSVLGSIIEQAKERIGDEVD